MSTYTYPNALNIQVQDNSAASGQTFTVLPRHLPIMFSFTEKGVPNFPLIGDTTDIQTSYGSSFLNTTSKFFNHQTLFVNQAIKYQQICFVRLVDPAATKSTLGIFCTVTPAQIVQYQRTATGALVYDENSNPIPQTLNGASVTADGYELDWTARALTDSEEFDELTPNTISNGGVTYTTYPIMAVEAADVGSLMNNYGFSLYYDSSYDKTQANSILSGNIASLSTVNGAMTYVFAPSYVSPTTAISAPVYDMYGSPSQTFAFIDNAYNPNTTQYLDISDELTTNFANPFPYNVCTYNDNIKKITSDILNVSPEITSSADLINIMTGMDSNNNSYYHFTITSDSAEVINEDVTLYLLGGSDGDTSVNMFEELVVAYLEGTTYPAIQDVYRYPITHFYDSGFALANKLSIIDGVMNVRDDVQLTMATQDVSLKPNTAAADVALMASLRQRILLHPESSIMGTPACRGSIYGQCAKLNNDGTTASWSNYVPATFDRLIKRCIYDGTTSIKAEPKPRPASEVTVFKRPTFNYIPESPDVLQEIWDCGANIICYATPSVIFYSDLRTVYTTDSSLLSDECIVDYVVYVKHIVRDKWTSFTGSNARPKTLFKQIQKSIDNEISSALNNIITSATTVTQTTVDLANGNSSSVTVALSGYRSNRVWNTTLSVNVAS